MAKGWVYDAGVTYEIVAGGLDTAARAERAVSDAIEAVPGIRRITARSGPVPRYQGTPGSYERAEIPKGADE